MNTHFAPRLLIPVFALVLIVAGALSAPASARTQLDELSWSETESQENVLVQTCDGFDLTTSYTVNRDYHRFIDVPNNLNVEWVGVDFAGAIGNSVTGKSYAYDGKLMRWSDYDKNETAITNLTLRFEVGTPGQFLVAIDRIELDLETDPSAVIKAFVPNALQMELCYLLADTSLDSAQQANSTAGFGESSVLIPPAHYLPGDTVPGNSDWCDLVYLHGLPC
jgi:hypothetical protein